MGNPMRVVQADYDNSAEIDGRRITPVVRAEPSRPGPEPARGSATA
jgi:hypothetical protein